jgi:hypothetical protein
VRCLEGFDEVNQHFDETVQIHRDEDPLQQLTQYTHGAAQVDARSKGEKKPRRKFIEVSETKKPASCGLTFAWAALRPQK